jgi:uncharacterized protein
VLRSFLLTLIRFYRTAISPLTPPSCRFNPTCSAYAQEAIKTHGVARGLWLFLRRFARCHPFGGKGYDPVPLPKDPAGMARREEARANDSVRASETTSSTAPLLSRPAP